MKESKKQKEIIYTAKELLLQFGSEKISIREIAKAANVSQVTIYNHFENKEDLIKKALESLIDEILLEYDQIIDSNINFEEKLMQLFDIRKLLNSHGSFYMLTKIAKRDDFIARKIEEDLKNKMEKSFLKYIKDGKREGKIDPKLSNKAILTYFQIFKDFYLEPKNAIKFTDDSTLSEEIWEMFWKGIKKKR